MRADLAGQEIEAIASKLSSFEGREHTNQFGPCQAFVNSCVCVCVVCGVWGGGIYTQLYYM